MYHLIECAKCTSGLVFYSKTIVILHNRNHIVHLKVNVMTNHEWKVEYKKKILLNTNRM